MTDELTDPTGHRHALALGDGHWLNWVTPYPDGPRIGAIIFHRAPPGSSGALGDGMCSCTVWFDRDRAPSGRPIWQVQGAIDDRVTMTPSVACGSCPDHGFITGGRWARA